MYDCHKDILAYHDGEVRLPRSERDEMRDPSVPIMVRHFFPAKLE